MGEVVTIDPHTLADAALFEVVQLSAMAIAHSGLRNDQDFRRSLSAKCKRFAMLQERCR
jgi:hypothetical protein